MSTTQVIDPADVICGLKAAVTALECYHNINLLKQQQQQLQQRKPQRPPMYMMVPIEEDAEKDVKSRKRKGQAKRAAGAVPPKLKTHRPADCTISDVRMKGKDDYCSSDLNMPGLKFPEMRSGILFSKCYCVHRNGLQDSCPLSQCQGQPECLVKPWPVCPPGRFLRSRYPELYSAPPNPESITY